MEKHHQHVEAPAAKSKGSKLIGASSLVNSSVCLS